LIKKVEAKQKPRRNRYFCII